MSATAIILSIFATATPAAPAAPAPVSPEDKVTCRKYPVTGSLTQKVKVCHTRREWKILTEQARGDVEKMQEMNFPPAPIT